MMNKIDINKIMDKINALTVSDYAVLNNLLERLNSYDGASQKEKERIKGEIKKLDKKKKIMLAVEVFIASDFSMSCRAIENYLKNEHNLNESVLIVSKSAIDRYLREESDLIIKIYGEDIYYKIAPKRREILEKGRIQKK